MLLFYGTDLLARMHLYTPLYSTDQSSFFPFIGSGVFIVRRDDQGFVLKILSDSQHISMSHRISYWIIIINSSINNRKKELLQQELFELRK